MEGKSVTRPAGGNWNEKRSTVPDSRKKNDSKRNFRSFDHGGSCSLVLLYNMKQVSGSFKHNRHLYISGILKLYIRRCYEKK